MANPRFNKQVTNSRKALKGGGMGGRTGDMMYSRGQGVNMRSKRMPTELMDRGAMKKGGKVGKKKQGYKARKDESIAMRIKKKRTKKQLKASRDDSYGKFGSKAKKSGKINKWFMAKDFIQKAIKKPGALRKSLKIKKGEKIPASKLRAAAKKKGKLGQRARFAMTLNKLRKKS